ncbi:zinc finger protein SNAI2-like [Branchiostoma floridae]|uniref:Zinc finger protein SNAI2-like n=1 Tax=Branchiostoma floridae TaxID=7739 RepID=A0A9J7LCM2_BRAFL|nr:zinc finger protein SNAI2-like [Branchiostoma floridae]
MPRAFLVKRFKHIWESGEAKESEQGEMGEAPEPVTLVPVDWSKGYHPAPFFNPLGLPLVAPHPDTSPSRRSPVEGTALPPSPPPDLHTDDLKIKVDDEDILKATTTPNNKHKQTKTKRERSDSESSVSPRGGETPTGPYHCPECGKRYSTSSNLARHRQTHRDQQDKKARKCPHCDKVYVSMPALSMHIRTHKQGCKCPYCGKCFSRPWLLQGHIRTHTGERPFVCQICEKAFADKSNLRAHTQTHSDAKPYVCGRCGKAFALKSYLYKHEESACLRSTGKVTKAATTPRQAQRQGAVDRRDPQAPIAVQG